MDSVSTCRVICGGNYTPAVSVSRVCTDGDGKSPEFRTVSLLNGSEKCVHVEMCHESHKGRCGLACGFGVETRLARCESPGSYCGCGSAAWTT